MTNLDLKHNRDLPQTIYCGLFIYFSIPARACDSQPKGPEFQPYQLIRDIVRLERCTLDQNIGSVKWHTNMLDMLQKKQVLEESLVVQSTSLRHMSCFSKFLKLWTLARSQTSYIRVQH